MNPFRDNDWGMLLTAGESLGGNERVEVVNRKCMILPHRGYFIGCQTFRLIPGAASITNMVHVSMETHLTQQLRRFFSVALQYEEPRWALCQTQSR